MNKDGILRDRYSTLLFSINGVFKVVVVVVLLFYDHGKHLRSCRDGQLT